MGGLRSLGLFTSIIQLMRNKLGLPVIGTRQSLRYSDRSHLPMSNVLPVYMFDLQLYRCEPLPIVNS